MKNKNGLSKRGLSLVGCLVALPLCAYIMPGVHVEPVYMSVFVGLLLGLFFMLLRPALKLLTLPVGCLTMGLGSLLIDTGVIWLLSVYLPGFNLDGVEWAAAIAAVLLVLRCPILR